MATSSMAVGENRLMIWWIVGAAALLILATIGVMRPRRVQGRVSQGYGGLHRSLRRLPLLPAVCFAVMGAVTIVLLTTWILDRLIHTTAKAADPIDITKLSFTVAGGVGAAVALVVAYRRQRDVEQGRFVERFGAAAAQLGDRDVAVRIAGVYAMAGVADESSGLRRQQCIDVLCGYLRLPYSPELGSASHRTKLVLTGPRIEATGAPFGQQEEHLEYRQNDKQVRATILRVISDHLRNHEYSWSKCHFDFSGACLEDANFLDAVFGGRAHFDDVTFSGSTLFAGATFCGTAWFLRASFSGAAHFTRVTFSDTAWFEKVAFSDYTSFNETKFSGAAVFGDVTFSGNTFFDDVAFCDEASFAFSTFSGNAHFERVRFSGDAKFGFAAFRGPASFSTTDFGSGAIEFDNPRQWGPPPPTFGWDADLAAKPQNVTPKSWPPNAVGEVSTK